jgi:hypothetical protein
VSKFAGTLYAEQGTYFASPWKSSDQVENVAGTATFQPSTSSSSQGTLIYTVNSGSSSNTVTKSVQRFIGAPAIPLAGTYYGGQSGAYSNCTSSSDNTSYFDYAKLVVTQTGTSASLTFTFTSNLTCTLSGTVSQNSVLFGIGSAAYLCSDQTNTTAAVSDLKITAQGIEGMFAAPLVGGGCREDARFSAVRN